jgi:hypothetical protein
MNKNHLSLLVINPCPDYMHKDLLDGIIKEIEHYCQQNGISVFYGKIEENTLTEVKWTKQGTNDWQDYLSVLKNLGERVLTIEIVRNDLELDKEAIEEYENNLSAEEREEYMSALKSIIGTEGEVVTLSLSFFHGNVSYHLNEFTSWAEHYLKVLEYVVEDNEDDEENDGLSQEEVEELARIIVQDNKYLECKNGTQRARVAASFARENGAKSENMDDFRIGQRAAEIYLSEVQPKIEQELKNKVQELKKRGYKKVEIRGRLALGETALNKYWY